VTTLLDTHAWAWWVAEDARLSKRARSAIERARRRGDLLVSPISAWEIAKKVEKRQLVLDRPLDAWLVSATTVEGLRLCDLSIPILVESCRLPQPFHGDPADQIIVASALHHGAILVSRDERIRDYPHVRSTW